MWKLQCLIFQNYVTVKLYKINNFYRVDVFNKLLLYITLIKGINYHKTNFITKIVYKEEND